MGKIQLRENSTYAFVNNRALEIENHFGVTGLKYASQALILLQLNSKNVSEEL